MFTELVVWSNHLIFHCPLLLLPPIFPASGSFPMSQFFASGGQSIGASALASVLPMNIQGWSLLRLTDLISLQSKGLSRVFQHHNSKHRFFSAQPSLQSNSHIHTWLLEKTIALARQTFVSKVRCLLFNMLSRLVIAFLPRSKHLLISWLRSPSAEILEPKKIESFSVSVEKKIANWHLFNTSYKDFWIQPLFILPATFFVTLMNRHAIFQPIWAIYTSLNPSHLHVPPDSSYMSLLPLALLSACHSAG